jgi:hypothetical protein
LKILIANAVKEEDNIGTLRPVISNDGLRILVSKNAYPGKVYPLGGNDWIISKQDFDEITGGGE